MVAGPSYLPGKKPDRAVVYFGGIAVIGRLLLGETIGFFSPACCGFTFVMVRQPVALPAPWRMSCSHSGFPGSSVEAGTSDGS